ncbi:MAG: hypothetical protein KDH96_10880 [Candidatus Riesia sp.]|nr:hypothetical protein [Candidatus Riesia sp.]
MTIISIINNSLYKWFATDDEIAKAKKCVDDDKISFMRYHFHSTFNDSGGRDKYEKTIGPYKRKYHRSVDKFIIDNPDYEKNRNILTKAFFKLHYCYEILLQNGYDIENALFLAELPGSSIFAMLHLFPCARWWANSMYYSVRGKKYLVKDEFKLIENYGDRWIGHKNKALNGHTGNLEEKRVRNDIQAFINERNIKLDLISCDGGNDTYNHTSEYRFNQRYMIMTALMQAEWDTARSLLIEHSAFVLKVYNSFYYEPMLKLITEICSNFRNVCFVKPAISKMDNDEFYLVCIDRKPLKDVHECTIDEVNKIVDAMKNLMVSELSSVIAETRIIKTKKSKQKIYNQDYKNVK